jgi:rhamnosyltransferase
MPLLPYSVIVPTYRPGKSWLLWLEALATQSCKPREVLVIDSTSADDTLAQAASFGYRTHAIAKTEFEHGHTRMMGVEMLGDRSPLIVFLTQDALLASPDSLKELIAPFEDSGIGAAYGRQLPYPVSTPIAAHERFFSYPEKSETRSHKDILRLGMRVARFSNSFGAYRITALREAGGFPSGLIFGEDQIAVSRMILSGWKVAYCAEATVYHSHNYSYGQVFRRYFDIGVMHQGAPWMLKAFGTAGGEGRRFIHSEFKYLCRQAPGQIPSAFSRNGLKLLGYRLGMHHNRLPRRLNRWLSMSPLYWK